MFRVNQAVVEAPERVNEDPYGDGWLLLIRVADPAELAELMDAESYVRYLETL